MEDVKGASHLSGKDRLLEKGVGKDPDKVARNDKRLFYLTLTEGIVFTFCHGQIFRSNPSADEGSLHIDPELITAKVIDSDE
jgi:hypothetical protein